jgi:hypothetical protein
LELTCDRCGRSSFVPDDLVSGRAFRAKCPDCEGLLEIPAERKNALDDQDLAWLSGQAPAPDAPPPEPLFEKPEVVEQKVAAFTAKATAQRRRQGAAMVAGAIVAGGLLLFAGTWALGHLGGPGPFSKKAREERAARGGGAAFDASGLLAKAAPPPAPAPAAAPAPAPAPLRKKGKTITRDDRKLLDLLAKKDDVTVIPAEVDEAVESAKGSLDPDAVGRTVAKNRKAFDACISRALRLNPNLNVARRATLVVTVQPSGSVTGAFIAEEEVDRTDLGACLSAAAKRMAFPAFEGEPIDVSMPLSLSAAF